jgi:hypothetical protein
MGDNVIAGKFWPHPEKLGNEIAAGAHDPEQTLAILKRFRADHGLEIAREAAGQALQVLLSELCQARDRLRILDWARAAEFDSRTWIGPPVRTAERGAVGTTESLEEEFLRLRKRVAEDEFYYPRDGARLRMIARTMGPERLKRLQQDQARPLDEWLDEISQTRLSGDAAGERQMQEIKVALAAAIAASVATEKRRRAAMQDKTRSFTAWLWRGKATTGSKASRTNSSVN